MDCLQGIYEATIAEGAALFVCPEEQVPKNQLGNTTDFDLGVNVRAGSIGRFEKIPEKGVVTLNLTSESKRVGFILPVVGIDFFQTLIEMVSVPGKKTVSGPAVLVDDEDGQRRKTFL
jgi:hypothetical protein